MFRHSRSSSIAVAIYLRISSRTGDPHLYITGHHSSKAASPEVVSTISASCASERVCNFRRQQLHAEAMKMGSYALLQLAEWKSLFS